MRHDFSTFMNVVSRNLHDIHDTENLTNGVQDNNWRLELYKSSKDVTHWLIVPSTVGLDKQKVILVGNSKWVTN